MIRTPQRADRDRGRVGVYFAIIAPALLAMTGLVVDGGGRVRALQKADNIAAEAARAAGQAIRAGQAVAGGDKQLDVDGARSAVAAYLAAIDGARGSLVIDDPQHLTVTVTITYDPLLLDLLGGPGAATVRGQAHATLVAQ